MRGPLAAAYLVYLYGGFEAERHGVRHERTARIAQIGSVQDVQAAARQLTEQALQTGAVRRRRQQLGQPRLPRP